MAPLPPFVAVALSMAAVAAGLGAMEGSSPSVAVDAIGGSHDGTEPPARRTRRTRDGRVFVFDAATNSWSLESPACSEESKAAADEPQLALPWSQFGASFDGSFSVGGVPLLLEPEVQGRSHELQQHGDTGRTIWDGAVALAKCLEHNRRLVDQREVLEVGSGRGVVGIAAALLGASRVVLSDLPYTIGTLDAALQRNGLAARGGTGGGERPAFEAAELDWSAPRAFLDGRPGEHFDVVLAADVVWLMELVEPLTTALQVICRENPLAEVLVVHQTRSNSVRDSFLAEMSKKSFRLLWELGGGAAATATGPAQVSWHPEYVPDGRISLWCFRLDPEHAGIKLP